MTSLASVDASITSPAEDKNFASGPPEGPCFRLRKHSDCMRQFLFKGSLTVGCCVRKCVGNDGGVMVVL
jgi:hypothetical protein